MKIMNRMFKHKFLTGIALVGTLFLGSACTDEWDDHYKDAGVNNNNQTLYEMIKADAQLSDFCAVVEACGVADSLLNASRVYTLWAPVNDSFDADAWIATINATKAGRDTVLVRFIEQHMADYLYTINTELDAENTVRVLNDKVLDFVGSGSSYTFGGQELLFAESNKRASNGVLHKLSNDVEYAVNVWEYLDQNARIDSVRNFLYSFNVRSFNEAGSIQGPTVNGEITYIDSAFTNSNMWFNQNNSWTQSGFGNISVEDSSYTFFAPTNEVWNEMVAKIDPFYNYYVDAKSDTFIVDSTRYMNTRKAFCNYLVFNDNEQKYVERFEIAKANPEEYMLANFRYNRNQPGGQGMFVRRLFKKSELMDGVVETHVLSNGTMYITEKFNLPLYDLMFDTIKIEGEHGQTAWTDHNETTVEPTTTHVSEVEQNPAIVAEVSGNAYITGTPAQAASRPQLTYKVPNILSGGKYRIGIVVVPPHILNEDMDSASIKPSKMRVQLKTRSGETGKQTVIYDTNSGKKTYNGLQNNPYKLDTIYLYDLALDKENDGDHTKRVPTTFSFDFCEYNLSAGETQTEITLTCDLQRRTDDAEWERTLRIDCIIFEPIYDEEAVEEDEVVEEEEEEEEVTE